MKTPLKKSITLVSKCTEGGDNDVQVEMGINLNVYFSLNMLVRDCSCGGSSDQASNCCMNMSDFVCRWTKDPVEQCSTWPWNADVDEAVSEVSDWNS